MSYFPKRKYFSYLVIAIKQIASLESTQPMINSITAIIKCVQRSALYKACHCHLISATRRLDLLRVSKSTQDWTLHRGILWHHSTYVIVYLKRGRTLTVSHCIASYCFTSAPDADESQQPQRDGYACKLHPGTNTPLQHVIAISARIKSHAFDTGWASHKGDYIRQFWIPSFRLDGLSDTSIYVRRSAQKFSFSVAAFPSQPSSSSVSLFDRLPMTSYWWSNNYGGVSYRFRYQRRYFVENAVFLHHVFFIPPNLRVTLGSS